MIVKCTSQKIKSKQQKIKYRQTLNKDKNVKLPAKKHGVLDDLKKNIFLLETLKLYFLYWLLELP